MLRQFPLPLHVLESGGGVDFTASSLLMGASCSRSLPWSTWPTCCSCDSPPLASACCWSDQSILWVPILTNTWLHAFLCRLRLTLLHCIWRRVLGQIHDTQEFRENPFWASCLAHNVSALSYLTVPKAASLHLVSLLSHKNFWMEKKKIQDNIMADFKFPKVSHVKNKSHSSGLFQKALLKKWKK